MSAIATDIITSDFEGKPISIRSDGYWNLTQMCQTHGKRINNFLRNAETQRYLEALSSSLNIPIDNNVKNRATAENQGLEPDSSVTPNRATAENQGLIEINQGGVPELQGVWGHQRVALKLAAWLNPEFEVWVYGVVEKLLTQGEVKLKDEIDGLRAALGQAQEQIEEYDVELALTEYCVEKLSYQKDELAEMLKAAHISAHQGLDI